MFVQKQRFQKHKPRTESQDQEKYWKKWTPSQVAIGYTCTYILNINMVKPPQISQRVFRLEFNYKIICVNKIYNLPKIE